jgi:hypothetical protein
VHAHDYGEHNWLIQVDVDGRARGVPESRRRVATALAFDAREAPVNLTKGTGVVRIDARLDSTDEALVGLTTGRPVPSAAVLSLADVEHSRQVGSASDLARSLSRLSNRLGSLGRRGAALKRY